MAGSFLDTTVLVNLVNSEEPTKTNNESFVRQHQPSEAAYYSLRELLAGYIRYLCTAHNEILGAESHAEALLAILNRPPTRGRDFAAKAIALSLQEAFFSIQSGSAADFKREGLQAM